ncbi:MAG: permease prefix domain 1-containing protein, partial [Terracidiphilus sp.]
MNWLGRRKRYDDLAVSIDEHIAEKTEDLIASGMSREEAGRQARRAFGNPTVITERSREAWQWPTLESLWADTRFALRQLLKSPGFTATAVLTLALGIAANATIFAMMTGFLMPKLPGRDADKVVVISSVNPDDSFLPDTYRVSAPNFQTICADTRAFAQTAALIDGNSGSLGGEHEQPEAIQYETVTPNFFSMLDATPDLG